MLKLAPATEQFQHFVSNLRESFWGDLNSRTRPTLRIWVTFQLGVYTS
jgi:hypothetical protein